MTDRDAQDLPDAPAAAPAADHHIEPDKDPAVPATPTEVFPRLRAVPSVPATDEHTRLDAHALYNVAEPTTVTPPPSTPYRDAGGRPVRVSPPGAHTRGAPAVVDRINEALDERDRRAAAVRPARQSKWRRTRKALTVRQHAERRELARMRHERHMETLETVKAYLGVLCLVILALLLIGMAAVAFSILAGYMTWAPTRV